MSLLTVYENMQKEAEVKALIQERVDVIEKYASLAEGLLQQEYNKDYTQDDVVELADKMIQHDLAVEDQLAKVAEYDEAGRIMARSFVEELRNTPAK
jgi:hypothetical protein